MHSSAYRKIKKEIRWLIVTTIVPCIGLLVIYYNTLDDDILTILAWYSIFCLIILLPFSHSYYKKKLTIVETGNANGDYQAILPEILASMLQFRVINGIAWYYLQARNIDRLMILYKKSYLKYNWENGSKIPAGARIGNLHLQYSYKGKVNEFILPILSINKDGVLHRGISDRMRLANFTDLFSIDYNISSFLLNRSTYKDKKRRNIDIYQQLATKKKQQLELWKKEFELELSNRLRRQLLGSIVESVRQTKIKQERQKDLQVNERILIDEAKKRILQEEIERKARQELIDEGLISKS